MFRDSLNFCGVLIQALVSPAEKAPRRQPRFFKPCLDPLEKRELLANYIWVGGTGNNWSTLANWRVAGEQPNTPPGQNDTATLDNTATNKMSVVDQDFRITSLQVSWSGDPNPSLSVAAGATLTLTGTSSVTGGTFGGAGNLVQAGGSSTSWGIGMSGTGTTTVAAGGTLSLSSTQTIDTRVLTINGTCNWEGPILNLINGAQINNAGTFNMQVGGGSIAGDGSANLAFNNTGTVNMTTSPSATISIQLPFNDNPIGNHQVAISGGGTAALQGGGSASGTLAISQNTTLAFRNGPQGQQLGYTWTGATFSGGQAGPAGTVSVNTDVVIDEGSAAVNSDFGYWGGKIYGLGSLNM